MASRMIIDNHFVHIDESASDEEIRLAICEARSLGIGMMVHPTSPLLPSEIDELARYCDAEGIAHSLPRMH